MNNGTVTDLNRAKDALAAAVAQKGKTSAPSVELDEAIAAIETATAAINKIHS